MLKNAPAFSLFLFIICKIKIKQNFLHCFWSIKMWFFKESIPIKRDASPSSNLKTFLKPITIIFRIISLKNYFQKKIVNLLLRDNFLNSLTKWISDLKIYFFSSTGSKQDSSIRLILKKPFFCGTMNSTKNKLSMSSSK